jgi:hypothetical protein
MERKILSEELGRMSYLLGYKRGVVVSEQQINIERPNWGKKTKGKLNFGLVKYAEFTNNNLFPNIGRETLLISSVSLGVKLEEMASESSAPIELSFSIKDPFKFDKTDLTESGENNFISFIKDYNLKKEKNIDNWSNYLEFIKTNGGVKVFGYSSQDSNPNDNDGGRLPACSSYGVGKGPRKQYNLCLSQKRAEIIKEKLIKELPELDGMVNAIGKGENCDNDLCWTKNNKITPEETSENRKFLIVFPKYISNVSDVNLDSEKTNKFYNKESEVKWDSINTYVDLTEFGYGKVKAVKDNNNMIILPYEEIMKIAKNLPIIGGGKINDSIEGVGEISEDGFILNSGGKKHVFKNWNDPNEIYKETNYDKSLFKVSNSILAVNDSPIRLKKISITLSYKSYSE